MKSLTGAVEIMTETQHAFRLIYNELLEKQVKIYLKTMDYSALRLVCLIKDLLSFRHYCTSFLADEGIRPY